MKLSIATSLRYTTAQPSDLLLQVEAAQTPGQSVEASTMELQPTLSATHIPAENGIGERAWLHVESAFDCRYEAVVDIVRSPAELVSLAQTPLQELPSEAVTYLMASRYCQLAPFEQTAITRFAGLAGGRFIAAARDWIEQDFTYDAGASNEFTSAHHTLETMQGVCRDYAHVLISLARSVAIPARMVSGYAPDVTPQDFHAVAEVFLDGAWHLVDATGMSRPDEFAIVGVGRDATDVSFMTAYGLLDLQHQSVEVSRIR